MTRTRRSTTDLGAAGVESTSGDRTAVDRGVVAWGVAGWTIVAGAAAALTTQFVGTPGATVAAVQALTPFAIVPVTAVAIVAAVRGQRWLGTAAALVGLGYLAVTAPLAFPDRGPEPVQDASSVRLAAANLLYSNDRIDDAGDALLAIDADVVALAEVTDEHRRRLSTHELADDYPFRIERPAPLAGGLLVWSRFPLVDEARTLERSIEATLDAPDGAIRLVFTHPPPPVFDRDRWANELRAVPAAVASRELPAVVFGDLNATTFHPPLRELIETVDLVDAVAAGGHELSMTWPTDTWLPPFARIDHVLVTRDLATVDADVVAIPGADHRAVVADVVPAMSG